MADMSDVLKNLGKYHNSVEKLNESLKEMSDLANTAVKRNDAKSLSNIAKLDKAIRDLSQAESNRLKLQRKAAEFYAKTKTADIETLKLIEEQAEITEQASKRIISAKQDVQRQHDADLAKMLKIKEAMRENFKENTLLGKSLTVASSGIAKFAGGLTFGAMAMKAWNNNVKSAELRQNILIQGFRGFDTQTAKTTGTIGLLSGALDKLGMKSLASTIASTNNFSNAMARAEGTAIRMGVSAEAVSDAVLKFSRIAGTSNPEALATMAEGAITVSRSLGIDTAQAIEFVQTRMDKFGGSSASAIVALNGVREETEAINKAFGRTVVRGDDVVKILQDISQGSNVYAIDQRLVGSILRDNIAKLQANGDSYDLARRKAEAFTKGVTGQAPEWMKILAGEDISSSMAASFNAGTFDKEFGEELEKASPGLSKKVKDVMADSTLGAFDKSRLIQELTAQTSVGISAVNKQVLTLYKQSGSSLTTLAKSMNVSYEEARGMVFQAQNFADIQKKTAEFSKVAGKGTDKELEALQELVRTKYNGLNISKEMAAVLAKDPKAMEEFVKQQDLSLDIAKSKTVFDQDAYEKKKKTLEADRDILKAELSKAEAARMNAKTDEERASAEKTAEAIRLQLRGKRQEIADLEGKGLSQKKEVEKQQLRNELGLLNDDLKAATEEGKTSLAADLQAKIDSKTKKLEELEKAPDENLQSIEDINKSLLKSFESYATVTGKSLQAMATEYSTLKNLALLTGAVGILGLIYRRMGGMDKIIDILAKYDAGKMSGGGRGPKFRKKTDGDGEVPDRVGSLGEKNRGTTKEQRAENRAKKSKALGGVKGKKAGMFGSLKKKAGMLGSLGKKIGGLAGKGMRGGIGSMAKGGLKRLGGSALSLAINGPEILDAVKGLTEGKFAESLANLAPTIGGLVGGAVGSVGGTALMPGAGTMAGGMAGNMAGEAGGEFIKDWITKTFVDAKPEKLASTIDKSIVGLNAANEAKKPTPINMATVTPETLSAAQRSMQGMTPQSGIGAAPVSNSGSVGSGSFGNIGPDGRATFTVVVDNMMDAFASANTLVKRATKA